MYCVAATMIAVAGCAEGTGQALTPTLPTAEPVSNADGTKLKASAPQPMSPRSIRVSNLTPQLVLENARTPQDCRMCSRCSTRRSSQVLAKSDPIPAGNPQTTWNVPANVLKMNKTYAWRAYAVFSNVQGSNSNVAVFSTPIPCHLRSPVPKVEQRTGSMRG